jgi:Fe-S cluster assembly ATP-binding protein
MLIVKNLHASIDTKDILKGIDLSIHPSEVHAIMGPNGAGKSTLAMTLMGHPAYKIQDASSKFQINEIELIESTPEDRAKAGLFVSFQSPIEITGVSFLAFLRTAAKALRPDEKVLLSVFKKSVEEALQAVHLDPAFMHRSVNEGFSGGERKRAEIAQLLVLKPKYAILDEIDSGLDVDSLKIVADAIGKAVKDQNIGILLITHYQRILHFLKPDFVHVMKDGKIMRTGTMALVKEIEKSGYASI